MYHVYSSKNIAKQWFADWLQQLTEKPKNILDFACGDAAFWPDLLKELHTLTYTGLDFYLPSLVKAQARLASLGARAKAIYHDGSVGLEEKLQGQYDLVTTFSSLEHVIDVKGFLQNMVRYCAPGGTLIVNYDDGHFVDKRWKARIHAFIAPYVFKKILPSRYLKLVHEDAVMRIMSELDCELVSKYRFNLDGLKGAVSEHSEVVHAAVEYEVVCNQVVPWDELKKKTLSTLLVFKKR